MARPAYRPYAPLQVLKPFAEDVWIADGPEIDMRYLGLSLPFPTRMTVVRLPGGAIWAHSPIAWEASLGEAVAALGSVRFLVAPNTLHATYLAEWARHFPEARRYAAPGLAGPAARGIDAVLGDDPPPEWESAFETCVVRGHLLTEVDFFHRPSRTLILTDLIENFEPERVRPAWLRWAMRLSGAADPDGKAPIDMQLSFIGYRRAVRRAARRMLAWAPERIVLAHGRCYTADGRAELARAFRWVL